MEDPLVDEPEGAYPVLRLLTRLLNSNRRIQRFAELRGPAVLLEDELRLREKILGKLQGMFPCRRTATGDCYFDADVIEVVVREHRKSEPPGI